MEKLKKKADKIVAKLALKAAKAAGVKSVGKAVPFLGSIFSACEGVYSLAQGDYSGLSC